MDPIAFSVFGLDIRWYGILISTGIIVAIILSKYTCKVNNVDFDEVINMFLVAFPVAVIGARLYYVIFQFEDYKDNLINVFNIRQGGLAIHGGIIFAFIAVYVYSKHKKLSFGSYMDTAAPCIILAQGIGRWGNFFNGEAHGGPVEAEFISKFPAFIQKGMYIDGVFYHPTFLYESIWNVSICILLLYFLNKRLRAGTILALYIGFYSLGRFFIEGLRTDSLMLGPIRMAQLISIVGILICISSILYIYKDKLAGKKM